MGKFSWWQIGDIFLPLNLHEISNPIYGKIRKKSPQKGIQMYKYLWISLKRHEIVFVSNESIFFFFFFLFLHA